MRLKLPLSSHLSLILPTCLLYLVLSERRCIYFVRDSAILFRVIYGERSLGPCQPPNCSSTPCHTFLFVYSIYSQTHRTWSGGLFLIRNPTTLNGVVARNPFSKALSNYKFKQVGECMQQVMSLAIGPVLPSDSDFVNCIQKLCLCKNFRYKIWSRSDTAQKFVLFDSLENAMIIKIMKQRSESWFSLQLPFQTYLSRGNYFRHTFSYIMSSCFCCPT